MLNQETIKPQESTEKRVGNIEVSVEQALVKTIKSIEQESANALDEKIPSTVENNGNIQSVNQEIRTLRETTIQQLQELSVKTENEPELTGIPDSFFLNNNYTSEQLAELRAKTRDQYGTGLVNTFHNDSMTTIEHEEAQRLAYNGLQEKIDSGVVKPDSISADLLQKFNLSESPPESIENYEQINILISQELSYLTESNFINAEEAELINQEAIKYAGIYREAYPDASLDKIFIITRDNARKLAYQTERDKDVFSGSDHGTKHILEGNMRMADKLLDQLGDRVSAKDKIIIHQIIIDHDLGYTVGIAQAKKSFEASKDHPIFSARFVADNRDYYIEMFGEKAFDMIFEGILQHSYPISDYNTPTDTERGFNPNIIRSITSTVDAIGVTAETKCPAFFRQPSVIKVLQKIKLYAETHNGKVDDPTMEKYRSQLIAIANQEPNQKRRDGFLNAITSQFNEFTMETTLGQYTGVLEDINLETSTSGEVLPRIKMSLSMEQALISDFFGDKLGLQAFKKAMKDFGITKDQLTEMGNIIRQIRLSSNEEQKKQLQQQLIYTGPTAIFEFLPDFQESNPEITQILQEAMDISINDEIIILSLEIENIDSPNPEKISPLLTKFISAITPKIDLNELKFVQTILLEIRQNTQNKEKMLQALSKFKSFVTKKEQAYLDSE